MGGGKGEKEGKMTNGNYGLRCRILSTWYDFIVEIKSFASTLMLNVVLW